MFVDYLESLRRSGKRSFSFEEIIRDLNISNNSAKSGLYRLKKDNKLISPIKGLYVLVPPEHQPYGCIPAEELVPIMANYLGAKYYVALLSAAAFYGAAHQKVFKFQIITNSRIVHPLEFGRIKIEVTRKQNLAKLPTKNVVVNSGYLKVATPELIAIDLLRFVHKCGGLNHVATVLSELVEHIDACELINLASNVDSLPSLQRLGYILETIDVMSNEKRREIVVKLEEYLKDKINRYIPLSTNIHTALHQKCKKWKIIENIEIESDL
ncbi:MAG: type IV toxin-antitoxin system AbiEi family antitoxin [Holosporales bacterium]|jgi:predicted transcriptional regulator of viral defense system|nr:type IV toxin-antitoxin system AbiEi family antitoxin [Holosporales bacterium]